MNIQTSEDKKSDEKDDVIFELSRHISQESFTGVAGDIQRVKDQQKRARAISGY